MHGETMPARLAVYDAAAEQHGADLLPPDLLTGRVSVPFLPAALDAGRDDAGAARRR